MLSIRSTHISVFLFVLAAIEAETLTLALIGLA
jgi:hypothetical protein